MSVSVRANGVSNPPVLARLTVDLCTSESPCGNAPFEEDIQFRVTTSSSLGKTQIHIDQGQKADTSLYLRKL